MRDFSCWACDWTWFRTELIPARKAWAIGGFTLRKEREAKLRLTCSACGAESHLEPGRVEITESRRFPIFGDSTVTR